MTESHAKTVRIVSSQKPMNGNQHKWIFRKCKERRNLYFPSWKFQRRKQKTWKIIEILSETLSKFIVMTTSWAFEYLCVGFKNVCYIWAMGRREREINRQTINARNYMNGARRAEKVVVMLNSVLWKMD